MKTKNKCSVLRDFVQSIDYNEELKSLKTKSIEHIKKSDISKRDKYRMSVQIAQVRDINELMRYLFNALLKFEGHGVI